MLPDMPALCRLSVSIMVVVVNKGFLMWRLCTFCCPFENDVKGHVLLKVADFWSLPHLCKEFQANKTVLKWAITVMSLSWNGNTGSQFLVRIAYSWAKEMDRKVKNQNSQNLRVFAYVYIYIYIYIHIYNCYPPLKSLPFLWASSVQTAERFLRWKTTSVKTIIFVRMQQMVPESAVQESWTYETIHECFYQKFVCSIKTWLEENKTKWSVLSF